VSSAGLEFNQRVLDQATSDYHPLHEPVKFLAIVGSNLDEFYMVQVATLLKKQRAGAEDLSADGLTASEELAAVRRRAARLMEDQAAC
jgi:polyphosphate kinase